MTAPLWARALLFAAIAPGMVAGVVPLLLARGDAHAGTPWLRATGGALVAGGVAALAWSFARFVREGRGTPAPYDPPRALVRGGLYRWSRNPMYVAVVATALGVAALHAAPRVAAYASLLAVAFVLRVRLVEEPQLRRRFGATYDAYCAEVPRWLPLGARRRPGDRTG